MSQIDFMEICRNGDIDLINSAIKDIELEDKNENEKDDGSDKYCWHGAHWNEGLKGACKGGHLDIVNMMIEHGADDWNWGLYYACYGGHLNVIDLMIEHNADLRSGLEGACWGGRLNIVKLMIDKGANNWNDGMNQACWCAHLDIMKLMIERGADNWNYIFIFAFDMIDSGIVKLMVERNVSFEDYLEYPKNVTRIFKLHELGVPIDSFKKIVGFDIMIKDSEDRKRAMKGELSDYLINDLIGIVNEYVIN